jgi:hypothetical protein
MRDCETNFKEYVMTNEQKQEYQSQGYYDNGCYNIAKAVFLRLYKAGERSGSKIKDEALKEMRDFCRSQSWNAAVTSYHIQWYGMKSLMYWLSKYANTLKP